MPSQPAARSNQKSREVIQKAHLAVTTPTPPANPNLTSIPDFSAGAGYAKVTEDPYTVNEVVVKPVKKKRLTQKQTKFVKAVAKGKPAYKAAAEAYDTKNLSVANAIAVENLQKPSIREALDAALEKAGITLEAAIAPIQDALEFEDPDGDQRTTLDMRLKGSDRALKLMGATQQEKETGGSNTFNFIGQNNFVKKADA